MSGFNKSKLRPKFIDQFAGNYWFYDAFSVGQSINQVVGSNFFNDVNNPTFRNGDILAVNAIDGNGIFNIRISSNMIFIETFASSINPSQKTSCQVGTTINITTLNGLQTIDGYTTIVNDRILVKDQTNKAFNGIYSAQLNEWIRTIDTDIYSEMVYSNVYVEYGNINANTGWVFTNADGGTINVTDIKVAKFSSSGATSFVGDYKDSSINANHSGWMLCNGLTISRTTYVNLYGIIGNSFGAGDGSTTFNLPDGRSRVSGYIGNGNGLTNRTLGQSYGEENHLLTIGEMPNHNHTLTDPGHNHTLSPAGFWYFSGTSGRIQNTYTSGYFPAEAPGTILPASTGISIASAGGGVNHNNMQPSLFIGNLFIYSGV